MRTRAATNGPDVVATDINGDPQTPAQPSDLAPLEHAPGVVAYSGPFPVTWASLQSAGTRATAEVEGRSCRALRGRPAEADPGHLGPTRRSGRRGRRSRRCLGLHVGDRVSLGGSSFQVVGIAADGRLPHLSGGERPRQLPGGDLGSNSIGLVWVPEADVAHACGRRVGTRLLHMDLKLADPAAAQAFADRYTIGSSSQQTSGPSTGGGASTSPTTLTLHSWQSIRSEDVKLLARAQLVLFTGSWLLVLLAIASVAVLVGGRMAEQTRRVGLLKAIGATPRFVALVLLCEYALVGLCAAGSGPAGRMARGAA